MNRVDEIVIDVVTLDWSYGWYGNFDVLVSPGSKLVVEWGDGKSERYEEREQTWVRLSHEFPTWNYRDGVPYRISIFTEEGQILGFSEALVEFQVENIDVSRCPSLWLFNFCYLKGLDLNRNPDLRVLECENLEAERLDLSGNRSLERLSCKFSGHLKELWLVNCDRLRSLDCSYCGALRQIKLSNRSALSEVYLKDVDLMACSKYYLCQIVERNGGTVVEDKEDLGIGDFPFGAAPVPDKKR